MRIEEIVLHGFKSFADRTVVPLVPGVVAVVGPNGSGKSNLVEAIRFAVGARARRLRGREPADLLFQGGAARRPAGFAEVALAFSAGDERLRVVRRLYRDGRQEVRLNGRRASLREVALALAGSGLGPSGAAVVGQGEVARVVEASPEVLLSFLVEAAGLGEVEVRLREAESRLAAAAARLEERRAEVSGLEAEERRLAEEAERARRVRELEARRLALRRGLLEGRLAGARSALEQAREALVELQERRRRLAAEREHLAAEREMAEALRSGLERERAGLGELRSRLLAAATKARERRRLLGRQVEILAESLAALEREIASLPDPGPPPPEPRLSPEELRRRKEALARELEERTREYRRALAAWEAYRQAEARYRAELAAYQREVARRRELRARLAALQAELEEVGARREALLPRRRELERIRARERELAARLSALEEEIGELWEALREGRNLSRGPAELLRAGLPGVVGSVAALLDLPRELVVAAEAALGGRLEWVVVEDEGSLLAAVSWLKARGLRATLLSRDLARPPRELPVPDLPGVEGRLRDFLAIPGDPRLTAAVVGETLLASDLESAIAAFRREPRRYVTRDGQVLEPSGAVSGGGHRRRGRLHERGRLLELERRREELAGELARARERAERLGEEVAGLSRLEERFRELSAQVALLREELGGPEPEPPRPPEPVARPSDEEIEGLRRQMEELEAEERRIGEWERYRRELAQRERLPELRERASRLAAELAEARAEAERAGRELERISLLQTRVEGLGAVLDSDARELASARERLALELSRRERELARLDGEREEKRLLAARQEALIESLSRQLAELPPGPSLPGSAAELRRVERELADAGPANFLAEAELGRLRERLEGARAELAEAEAAWRRLLDLVAELKGEYQRRLLEAGERVSERFSHYVREMLGGEGRVERTPRGLELYLSPGGKRVRALWLLSTGEKTMGALALLFALAEVREGGLPIAVLDEVDAALDEANLGRFARFLGEFKRGRQVILVTHQKRTLEAADAVVGVTQVRGVSRVYTIRRGVE